MKQLNSEDWAYLATMPLTCHVPEHRAVLVHAGFLPGRRWRGQPARVVPRIHDAIYYRRVGDPASEIRRNVTRIISATSRFAIFVARSVRFPRPGSSRIVPRTSGRKSFR